MNRNKNQYLSIHFPQSTSKRPSVSMDKGVDDGDDSALSAYDPYGRNKHVYRGIRLHEDTDRKTQVCTFIYITLSNPLPLFLRTLYGACCLYTKGDFLPVVYITID